MLLCFKAEQLTSPRESVSRFLCLAGNVAACLDITICCELIIADRTKITAGGCTSQAELGAGIHYLLT